MSVDPSRVSVDLANPQSWNRYTYVKNDPINRIDQNGKWDEKTHNALIDKAFPGLSLEQKKILYRASRDVDGLTNQGLGGAHDHAQKRPWKSSTYAKGAIEDHIKTVEKKAQAAQGGAPTKVSEIKPPALEILGQAIHTEADKLHPVIPTRVETLQAGWDCT